MNCDCTEMERRQHRELDEAIDESTAMKRAGYVLAMRLLQSDIALDDEERAACEMFSPQNANADRSEP